MEISNDVKRAYAIARETAKYWKENKYSGSVPLEILADFARDALAEAMRAQNEIARRDGENCRRSSLSDTDWQTIADRMLRGETDS